GPLGTTGAVGAITGGAVTRGGGGAALGLKRNRLRSEPTGLGRSPVSVSRCTSGAPCAVFSAFFAAPLESLDGAAAPRVEGFAGDGCGPPLPRYTTTASTATSRARIVALPRSMFMRAQRVVRRQLQRQRQRLVRVALHQSDVIDDDEL